MEFNSIEPFLEYYGKVRKRTFRIIEYIPESKIEWTYKEGKFTLGDIIRHIANIERDMYAENALFRPSRYEGCGTEYAEGYQNVVSFMNEKYEESIAIFEALNPDDLQKKTTTPGGASITLWKWLRLMPEHEIHHRGQIYMYLNMLGVETPPLYGMTSEEVAAIHQMK